MGKRIASIDVAKGISIILVAFHHSKLTEYLTDLDASLALFRMPLFFFLSGVFFKPSIPPKEFFLKKTDALLKPYFFTLFLLFFLSLLFEKPDIVKDVVGIIYGNGDTIKWVPLWFLTHLWGIFVVSYVLLRYTRLRDRGNSLKIMIIFLLFFTGSYLLGIFWQLSVSAFGVSYVMPGLPFSMDFVFLSMAFFVSGYFLNHKVKVFTPNAIFMLVALLMYFLIAEYTQAQVVLNSRVYNEPILATLAAYSGIYVALSVSHYMCKNVLLTKAFTMFGAGSLFILIFHSFVCGKIYWVLFYELKYPSQLFCGIVSFAGSITIPLLMKKLIWKSSVLRLCYFPLQSYKLSPKIAKLKSYIKG